jgi:iron complex outermembrane receptor protein
MIFYAPLTAALLIAGGASAQSSAPQQGASELEALVVTGTRRTDRSVADSPTPIDVLSSRDLQQQPSGDMNVMLRNLVPSFNVGRFIGINSDGSAFVRPPTLRGLPPDQILVLVNSKRRHRSALVQINGGALASGAQAVDLAQIPAIAVDRVEVLRDGASAQYGSDAIAGVINYQLKRNNSGAELTAKYGQYYEGDGENYQLSGNIGLPLTDRGFVSISGEYLRSYETSRGADRPGVLALRATRPDIGANIRNPAQLIGDPDVEAKRVFINAGFEISEAAEVYAFGNYGKSHQETEFNFRQPYGATGIAQSGVGTQFYPASSVYNTIYLDQLPNGTYDVAGRTFTFHSVYPNGYNPRFMGDIRDISATGGLRGTLGSGLRYDLSASRGESRIVYNIKNTLNLSLGPQSPTEFYAGTLTERDTSFNADFSYPMDFGLASPITLAAGAEHRTERYIIAQGDAASYAVGPYAFQRLSNGGTATQAPSSNGFPGFAPKFATDSSRNSYAFYGDAEGDLTERLSMGVAVRYEHFSDFGSTTNWKISGRYEISEAVALRGAVSTGFRAPTAGQLFTAAGVTGFIGPNPTENVTLPATDPAAQFFGATPLTPEKSFNIAGGVVIQPFSGASLTIDYYNIQVEDRLGRSQNFQITNAADPVAEAATRERLRQLGVSNWQTIGNLAYFTNAFETRTQGVDVVASYRRDTEAGLFTTTLAANYNATKVTDRDARIINDVTKGNIENLVPQLRGSLTQSWTTGPLALVARANYFGSIVSYALPVNGGTRKFGEEVTLDLEGRWDFNDNFSFAMGVENVLDEYPDKNIRSRTFPGPQPANGLLSNWFESTQSGVEGSRYLDAAPFGYNGGFWYARFTARY